MIRASPTSPLNAESVRFRIIAAGSCRSAFGQLWRLAMLVGFGLGATVMERQRGCLHEGLRPARQ